MIKDAEAFYKMNLDPEVVKYTGDQSFKSVEEARQFIQNYDAYEKTGLGRWAVLDKENDKFIGFCGFKMNEEGLIDLGFRFIRSEWNKGYATEAARACLTYGFEKLRFQKIIGRVAQENEASIRVLSKIGMKYWKKGICEGIDNALYFRLTKEEFRNLLKDEKN
jgi:RimJ/RimL family protein N-acetyltransferase